VLSENAKRERRYEIPGTLHWLFDVTFSCELKFGIIRQVSSKDCFKRFILYAPSLTYNNNCV